MAKNIRWQIPFVSVQGIHYRVDIYDEGTFTPVELQAGEKPFVTNEDASEDFFYPVRTQTGTLQVCTLLPGTTDQYITLEDLLPANNIARPVRLLNLDNSNAIEWQGFLSCEAYSQDYTGIAQNLDLPVISVLEAMASVQLDQSRSSGLAKIKAAVKAAMNEIVLQSGMSFYTHVNYSGTSYKIFDKYIDQTVLFEQKEYNNENSTTYIVSGLSAKDALERIATYMGWVVREQGTKIYFERMGDDIYTWEETYADFGGTLISVPEIVNFTEKSLATDFDDKWMGADHQRTIAGGAKSVEVVAKVKTNDFRLNLPDFPYNNNEIFYKRIYNPYEGSFWVYIVAEKNTHVYSNVSYKFQKWKLNVAESHTRREYLGEFSLQDTLNSMIASNDPQIYAINIVRASSAPPTCILTAGAFLAQVAYESQSLSAHKTTTGLYCVWAPAVFMNYQEIAQSWNYDPIAKLSSKVPTNLNNGYIKLSASMTHLIYSFENYTDSGYVGNRTDNWTDKILIHVRVGDMYWNGSEWTTTPSKFLIDIQGTNFKKNWAPSMFVTETDGFLIPINTLLTGYAEIAIYCPVNAEAHQNFTLLAETFFSSLDVDYLIEDNHLTSDRSENHYFRLLGTNFRDEISIGTDLASFLNNKPSPSLIMDDETTPMKFINYLTGSGTESRRPEVDLLNRLASYYVATRQRLELEVAHPTAAPLPLLKLQDIDYATNGKVYLPLSESRDWQTDVCKLTCFETPEEPAES
jgi:hypothetical protein